MLGRLVRFGNLAGMTDTTYLSWLVDSIRPQTRRFAGSVIVKRNGDRSWAWVEFSRPSPLGLLMTR